jgi:hypothetical protein
MAMTIVSNITGIYHPRIIDTNAGTSTCTTGYAYYLVTAADGTTWTTSGTNGPIDGICIKSTTAGATAYMEAVKNGDIVEADYSGTASTSFLVGLKCAVLESSGASVDATALTDGHIRILSIDTTNTKCRFVTIKNFTDYTTS